MKTLEKTGYLKVFKDFNHCDKGHCKDCTINQRKQCEKETEYTIVPRINDQSYTILFSLQPTCRDCMLYDRG